jgi:hypothetical protein
MDNRNYKFQIELREDGFQAWLKVFESSTFTLADVAEQLKAMGISQGFKGDYIKKLAEKGFPFGQYLIAEGKFPIKGEDSRSECLVELTPEPPKVDLEDNKTNYFPVWITNVVEGQKLVKYIPATRGVPGLTVFGREIPAMPGKTLSNPRSINTDFMESNPNFLIAKKSGNFLWDGEKARVEPDYTINGDLSILNGEFIEFVGNLKVLGDIKSGTRVKVGGELIVFGTVEDMAIECGGNVTVKGGMFGSGKGEIIANGKVDINHAYNFSIKATDEMTIRKEVVACQIKAKSITGVYATILGGNTIAQNFIEINDLGKEQYSRTSVIIGGKSQHLELLQNLESEIFRIEKHIKELKDNIFNLAKEKMNSKNFPEDKEEALQNSRIELERINKKLSSVKENRNKLLIEMKQYVPKLIVNGSIHPNVHVTINDISIMTSMSFTNTTFYEKDNEIVKIKNTKF